MPKAPPVKRVGSLMHTTDFGIWWNGSPGADESGMVNIGTDSSPEYVTDEEEDDWMAYPSAWGDQSKEEMSPLITICGFCEAENDEHAPFCCVCAKLVGQTMRRRVMQRLIRRFQTCQLASHG